MALIAAIGRQLASEDITFAVVSSGSGEVTAGDPGARVVVLIGAIPDRRLPAPPIRSLADATEHEIRSTTAEVLTATRVSLGAAVERLRLSADPASLVVLIPATSAVGRIHDGVAGIPAAGLSSLVPTLARELADDAIAVNAVLTTSQTSPDRIAAAVAGLAAATRDGPTITGQIIDVADATRAPTTALTTASTAPSTGTRPNETSSRAGALDLPRFAGKVALVTGAVRPPHMGRATALRLATEGADVVLVDAPAAGNAELDSDATEPGALEDLVAEIKALGRRALAIPVAHLGSAESAHLVEVIVDQFGQLDVVCHLGGGTGSRLGTGPLLEITDDAWGNCLDTNLFAPWFVAQAAVRQMRAHGEGGSIVLLSSYAVRDHPARYGAFCAARTGVVRLAEVLAQECAADGIRVNTVLPLGVAPDSAPNPGLADLVRHSGVDRSGVDASTWARERIPMGRMQDPAETAAAFAFLASDDASFISGQALAVAGGAVD